MIQSRVQFSRRLLATLMLPLALSGRADDNPKKPAEDSIAASKKDLEAMRAERVLSTPEEKLGLPTGLDTSALSAGPAAPSPSPRPEPTQDPLTAPVKSSGWLIDGMEKARNGSTSDPAKAGKSGELNSRGPRETEYLPLNSKDRPDASADRSKAVDREASDLRDAKAAGKVPNPLSGYMATWMTPGDFALLQKPAAPAGTGFRSLLPEFSPGGTPRLGGASDGMIGTAPTGVVSFVPAGVAGAPQNPYLQSAGGVTAPMGGMQTDLGPRQALTPLPAALPAPPAWLSAPPLEPARNTSVIPENLKPSDDAKYFPQLKRF